MRRNVWTALAMTAALAVTLPAWAQSGETAAQNVRESEQYERLVCSNPAFRAKRITQECGPLQGSPFYDSCVASFQCGARAPNARNWRRAPASEMVR